ncbi:thiamine pyrophosphate-binding protein [Micrococcales bacterium 31B]|nr:thiamine pyrophosphate-binding protein [Micrococcales bacterium 31B]
MSGAGAASPGPAASGPVKIATLVGRVLARLGAGHVFGVVGSGNFEVTNALREAGVPFTATRHEAGAATAADAYSRMSGGLGIATTHQGCGLTNAVTGIGEAAKSRTPLLVVTADAQAAAIRSNFKIDQDALARSVGAVAERVHSPESAVADVVRAYRTAMNERRTVVLSLPLDVQAAVASEAALAAAEAAVCPPAGALRPSEQAVAEFVEMLREAERPVFVAGRGARGAGPEIAALAASAGALLATSAVAKGLFEGEEFNLGISGGFSSPLTAELIGAADLIVGWGCALNMWTMRHGALIGPRTRVVQVDVEDAALGANRPIDLGVLGDSALVARDAISVMSTAATLGAALEAAAGPFEARTDRKYRTPEVGARLAAMSRWRDVPITDLSTSGADARIDPRVLSREVDALLPSARIVSIDSGNFMGYPSQYFEVPDHHGFCFTQAFQAIGLGLYTALGAAYAQPERLPVLGVGDGGFLMAVAEMETIVRAGVPLVCVVYNDAAYGAEVHHFEGADHATVTFPETDIAAIARGFGADAVTVRSVDDLAPLRGWVSRYLGGDPVPPFVIDAKIASDGGSWWLAEAFKGH